MGLIFVVLSGPREGDRFRISPGLTIGRKAGISLKDPRASSLHAVIEENLQKTHLVLKDQESANGVWVNEERVSELILKPGVQFRIGNSILEVLEETALDAVPDLKDTWQGQIWMFLRSASWSERKTTKPNPFKQPLKLSVTAGPQTNTIWYVGYGPRSIGSESLEFRIEEPGAPAECFSLFEKEGHVFLETTHTGLVLLNGEPVSSEKIKTGDTISFLSNQIQIEYK